MLYQRNNRVYIKTDGEDIEITKADLNRLRSLPREFGFGNEILPDYPLVRNPTNVRELFIRIYDQLEFEVLASQEAYPNYILRRHGKNIVAHAVLKTKDMVTDIYADCDLIICWEDDADEIDHFEILEIHQYFDMIDLSSYYR